MATFEEYFGQEIRRRRELTGHSQEAFAEKAGIHRTYVSSIELGKVQVSVVLAKQLADALDVPLHRIIKKVEGQTEPKCQ